MVILKELNDSVYFDGFSICIHKQMQRMKPKSRYNYALTVYFYKKIQKHTSFPYSPKHTQLRRKTQLQFA